jgi:hypothetical protein
MPATLSTVLITLNEAANLPRTLASVQGLGEIIVVDSGSTDATVEIARHFGARVFIERWKGFGAQKNSAIEKAAGGWILSLDADEELSAKSRRCWRPMQPRHSPHIASLGSTIFSGVRCATAATGPIPSCASSVAVPRTLKTAPCTKPCRRPDLLASSRVISSTIAIPPWMSTSST